MSGSKTLALKKMILLKFTPILSNSQKTQQRTTALLAQDSAGPGKRHFELSKRVAEVANHANVLLLTISNLDLHAL